MVNTAIMKNMYISNMRQNFPSAINGSEAPNRVPSSVTSTVTYPKFTVFVCKMTQSLEIN